VAGQTAPNTAVRTVKNDEDTPICVPPSPVINRDLVGRRCDALFGNSYITQSETVLGKVVVRAPK